MIDHAPDVVVATTAIGFRGWVEAADGWGIGDALLERLRGVELLARGPKVKGSVRAAGLTEAWSPGSESLAEVLDRLLAEGVAGRRIAVQLHGEPLPGFIESLQAAGAEIVGVPVYRWMPPQDIAPLDRLLDATAARALDAITFTSAPAAASFLGRAEERGLLPEVLGALRDEVLAACVGPVTALPLQARAIPTVQPERFRLGPSSSSSAPNSPPGPGSCPSPATASRSGATPSWSTTSCARCRPRAWPSCAPWPAAPAGWWPAPTCCGRCPAAAPTSTRWRRRWPGCARPWGRRS